MGLGMIVCIAESNVIGASSIAGVGEFAAARAGGA